MHTPTAPEDILSALDDFVRFINVDCNTDILIKTALAHYQFEMIHPFENRNGIVGRIIIPMILSNANYKVASYLCLSETIYQTKLDYFDLLSATQMGSGYAPWVKYFVRSVCEASSQAIALIEQFTNTVTKDMQLITALRKSSKHICSVYDYFKQHLISEIKPIAKTIGISYNTAAKVIKTLENNKIVSLERKQFRHKVYRYDSLVSAITREGNLNG
jgi:Fic family protein